MGVRGLWRLLMPIGRRISIETLEGKVLAVDASIWLTQFLKAMRDPDTGKVRPAAHLIGFIRRLCKLRYQGIRPIFVFDGATPEIKQRELRDRRRRREQFSRENQSVDVVQRAAKRILLNQLKKQGSSFGSKALKRKGIGSETENKNQAESKDTTTANGAYAPGFYDPEMNSADEKMPATNHHDVHSQLPKLSTLGSDGFSTQSQAEPELVQILEGGTDYLDEATSGVNDQNDWDTTTIDQNHETGQDQSDGSGTRKQITGQRQPEGAMDIRKYSSAKSSVFDPNYIASLPSSRRKDLVEHAQRDRRLQSRREFMKVASDPEGLSKCQLRNFLKSTRLNQDIHKMAQQASKEANHAMGESKHIIFETDMSDSEKKRESKMKALGKFRENKKLSVMSSSDDESEDDIAWQDQSMDIDPFQPLTKTRASFHDGDDDESDRDSNGITEMPSDKILTPGNGRVSDASKNTTDKLGRSSKRPVQLDGRSRAIVIEDDDNVLEDGDAKIAATTVFNTKKIQELKDEGLALALQEAEYDSDEAQLGGGFLATALGTGSLSGARQAQQKTEFTRAADDESAIQRAILGKNEQLCLSAHKTENAPGANDETADQGTLSENIGQPYLSGKKEENALADNDEGGNRGAISAKSGQPYMVGKNEESHNISRRKADCSGIAGPVFWSEPSKAFKSSEMSKSTLIKTDEADRSIPRVAGESLSSENCSVEAGCLADDTGNDEEDDSVDWEDGEKGIVEDLSLTRYNEFKPTNTPSANGTNGCASVYDQEQVCQEEPLTGWKNEFSSEGAKKDEEMSVALKQGQSTAASLTNWAGRAFRRAVAEHAAESGFSTSEELNFHFESQKVNDENSATKDEGTRINGAQHATKYDESLPLTHEVPALSTAKSSSKGQRSEVFPAWSENMRHGDVADTLQDYQERWSGESNMQDRDMDTVTDEMRIEAINLLQLFGVPFVEAPAEAEAQCAMLEKLGLVDGIITEDSDAFVFGGNRIYKNIFEDQKYVEVYDAQDAKFEMNLTRDGLVALAMLLGGDYSEGVKGVGIVNGMEIVQAFEVSDDVEGGLQRFRQWLDGFDPSDSQRVAIDPKKDLSKKEVFHRKHQSARTRWVAPQYFPDKRVLNAYLKPVVDTSAERFTWGVPDLDKLILFCRKHVGWTPEETRKLVQPVVEQIESGGSVHQTRIESFMRYEDGIKFADVRSKRLRDVLSSLQNPVQGKDSGSGCLKKAKV